MTSYGSGLREVLAKGAHACCGRMTVLAVSDGNRWDHRCDSLETLMVYRWSLSGQRCFLRVSKGDAITEFSLFPTHVGVYRCPMPCPKACLTLPHARGGVPLEAPPGQEIPASSPRTWGCTATAHPLHRRPGLFPTHVGVYRVRANPFRATAPLPHARGGVPVTVCAPALGSVSSPRTWGCTDGWVDFLTALLLFPTHVGVYRGREGPAR